MYILILLIIDQVAKWLVKANLQPCFIYGENIPILKYIVNFTYVENTGAAFGMMNKFTVLLSIFTAVIISLFIYEYYKKIRKGNSILLKISFILMISGALGNLIDRVFRGYVIDFIDLSFMEFAVFNFADCYITIGCITLMIYILFFMDPNKKEKEIIEDKKEKEEKKKEKEEK